MIYTASRYTVTSHAMRVSIKRNAVGI